ncbi:MAG: hypothetical protein GC190_21170 [Alphaproteobacteria bacterium]|nr:hypothetical protein [Alphaproteobacteria bacterium]
MFDRRIEVVAPIAVLALLICGVAFVLLRGQSTPAGSAGEEDQADPAAPLAQIPGDGIAIRSLSMSSDGEYLAAVSGMEPQQAKIWSMARKAWTQSIPAGMPDRDPAYLSPQPCRGIVAISNIKIATLFDCTGNVLRTLHFASPMLESQNRRFTGFVARVIGVCNFSVIQLTSSIAVVDLAKQQIRQDVADWFTSGSTEEPPDVAAPSSNPECLAYAAWGGLRGWSKTESESLREPSILRAIDMRTGSSREIARLNPSADAFAPYIISYLSVSPNRRRAVALTLRESKVSDDGQNCYMEIIDVGNGDVQRRRCPSSNNSIPGWIDDDHFFFVSGHRVSIVDATQDREMRLRFPFPDRLYTSINVAVAYQRGVFAVSDGYDILLYRFDQLPSLSRHRT